ncbi:hypothetical protein [Aureimonas sp. ME7]|uniref:hypothetical protein n=1 Tax=Aureimonas sp. ME7 TaxID=2744252 RepID=UPI0015F5905C|nr:hypothetical protein [Aureimonas sp. ME7]
MARAPHRPTSFDQWLYEESTWDQKHDDREYTPQLSARDAHDQPWRIPRLVRVYETAKQLFLVVENRPLPATIVTGLFDDKGSLAVTVSTPDWQKFLLPFFQLAWRAENEKPDTVSFAIADRSSL